MRLLCLMVLALLSSPRPANACRHPYIPIFQMFDSAAIVAKTRVRQHDGKVVLEVLHAFKGSPGNTISLDHEVRGPHSTCSPQLKGRSVGIIFLTKDRRFAAAFDSFPAATKSMLTAITQYANATDAKSRAAVLVDQIAKSKHRRIVLDAGLSLADDPEALVHVTEQDRDRLRLLLPVDDGQSLLPLVLVRLGAPDIEKHLPKFSGELAMAKHRTFEAITKPEELARVIEKEKAASPRAAAAFERCERLHAKRLASIRNVVAAATEHVVHWSSLAEACRTGKPLSE